MPNLVRIDAWSKGVRLAGTTQVGYLIYGKDVNCILYIVAFWVAVSAVEG